MKKRNVTRLLAGALATVLLLSGCGGAEAHKGGEKGNAEGTGSEKVQNTDKVGEDAGDSVDGEKTMGRYIAEELLGKEELEAGGTATDVYTEKGRPSLPIGLNKTEEGLEANFSGAEDYLIREGEAQVQKADATSYSEEFRALLDKEPYIFDMAKAPSGSRIFSLFDMTDEENYRFPKYILLSDGSLREWKEAVDENTMCSFWYGEDGYFYAQSSGEIHKLYRVSAETGQTEFLTELSGGIVSLYGNGTYLFLNDGNTLSIFDMASKTFLEEDTVLSRLLSGELAMANGNKTSGFLIADGENPETIYIATKEGIFRHVLYGNVMEQLCDGALSNLSDVTKYFVDMYVDADGAMPVFYLLYNDGRVMRFAYDETVPAVPDTTLKVYSLYDDNNIRMALGAYQSAHPEIYLKYEVGIEEETGETKEDALKKLATQLAEGSGPDVLSVDGLPFDSYVEKGVLADLGGKLQEMGKDVLWDNIVDDFGNGEAVYAVPMVFQLPVFSGDSEKLEHIKTLSDLADVLEQEKQAEGKSLMGLFNPEDILSVLGLPNANQWLKDGALDKAALTDFLTQCKRIYEANLKSLSEEEIKEQIQMLQDSLLTVQDRTHSLYLHQKYSADGRFIQATGTQGLPYSAGVLGGNVYTMLNSYLGWLNAFEKDYMLIPGAENTCMAETVLAVNNSTGEPEAAMDFLQYAMSAEFQAENELSGIPVNKEAFYKQQVNPNLDENGQPSTEPYVGICICNEEGVMLDIEYGWATEEELAHYNSMVESIEAVKRCEGRVFDAVLTEGAAALRGTKGIEEAINAIEEKVRLYLAE